MRVRVCRRIAVLLLAAGCQSPAPELAPRWGRWFSFGDITGVAVSPDGEHVVVTGVSTRDIATPSLASPPREHWLTRLDAHGIETEPTSERDGALHDVQIDDAGNVYALEARAHDPSDIDAPPTDDDRRLVAFDASGDMSWSMSWESVDGNQGPDELVLAADVLVVRDDQQLTGVSRDGAVLWRATTKRYLRSPIAREGAVWFVVSEQVGPAADHRRENVVVRCDPASGAIDEVVLADPSAFVGGLEVTASEFLVRNCASPTDPRCETVAFDHGGAPRWRRRDNEREWQAWPPAVALVADDRGHWQLATERQTHDPEAPPSPTPPQEWIGLHHFTADGRVDARLRRAFVDDATAAADSNHCPSSDTGPAARVGSSLDGVLRLGDGLLVVGHQGCRDAFLLALDDAR